MAQACARDRQKCRADRHRGVERHRLGLHGFRHFSAQQIAPLRLAEHRRAHRHFAIDAASDREKGGGGAGDQFQFDFAQGRLARAGAHCAAVQRHLHLRLAFADQPASALDIGFEQWLDLVDRVSERLLHRRLRVQHRHVRSHGPLPFLAREQAASGGAVALDGLHLAPPGLADAQAQTLARQLRVGRVEIGGAQVRDILALGQPFPLRQATGRILRQVELQFDLASHTPSILLRAKPIIAGRAGAAHRSRIGTAGPSQDRPAVRSRASRQTLECQIRRPRSATPRWSCRSCSGYNRPCCRPLPGIPDICGR